MTLKIDEWRRLRCISEAELARRCGVSVPTIRGWEKYPENIKIKYMPILAEALGVEQEDIIFLP